MDDNKDIKKEPQMAITPEVAHGIYSNISLITHSNSEFIIDFARMPRSGKQNNHDTGELQAAAVCLAGKCRDVRAEIRPNTRRYADEADGVSFWRRKRRGINIPTRGNTAISSKVPFKQDIRAH